ncbi:MAG: hypothetical protein Q4F13_15495 [Pseudomonadota bacterium]|nr:hypothetical protein [Pseudomonadota bacterium]
MNAAATTPQPIGDEELLAYLDAELPEEGYEAIEAQLDTGTALRQRLQALVDSGERLRAAYDGVLQEPVPPALIAAIQAAPWPPVAQTAPQATPHRAAHQTAPSSARRGTAPTQPWPQRLLGWLGLDSARPLAGLAVASVLMLAVGGWLGHSLPAGQGDGASVVGLDGALAVALETAPSGRALQAGAARIELAASLRGADGRVCREYSASASGGGETGLACRAPSGQWTVAVRQVHSGGAGYDTASSSGHEAIDAYLSQHLPGAEPLSAEQEQALIQKSWSSLP